jgi:hypothetical protein
MDTIQNFLTGKPGEAVNYVEVGVNALDEKVGRTWANAIITFSIIAPAMYAAFLVAEALALPVIICGAAAISSSPFFEGRDESAIIVRKTAELARMCGITSLNFLEARFAPIVGGKV